jgi:threonine aldolase
MDAAIVDLRSDTVTRPTAAMRKAMAEAEVGDDLYGEDPTVNALQERYAARVGKDAALYVPSGTMANQIAIRVLTTPGTTVLAGRRAHVVMYEHGAASRNAGVQMHPLADDDGLLDPAEIGEAVTAAGYHNPTPSLLCIENTHMPANGRVWPLDRLAAAVAATGGLPVHLDGARLFNAEVASGIKAADFAATATTVMSCLSKGLGAPVGSLLAGPADVIDEARAVRQQLGGAMRQAGVIAAAGIVALDSMVERLADDHARARRLADAVADRWPDAGLDPTSVETNIVVFRHPDPAAMLGHLADNGVRAGLVGPTVVRFVTHLDVDDDGIDRAVSAIASAP